jgi:predicted glutamine amidotransferase
MCKVMMMAGVTSDTRDNAWKFIKEMAKEMSPSNMDGLGYAALSTEGELFGERWHHNGEAFNVRQGGEPLSPLDSHLIETYAGALRKERPPIRYNKFGSVNEDSLAAITLHTRMATSGKEFMNTHPFVVDGTSLIHNGVIRNADKLEMIQSTCDSEAILNLYVKHKVMQKPTSIQSVAKKLQGYYACGVLSHNESQGHILDVFKCSNANLGAAFVQELNTVVFSTRVSDIKAVCTRLGFNVLSEFVFEAETLLRIDALTGEPIETISFIVPAPKYDNPKPRRPKVENNPVARQWKEEVPEERQWLYQGDWWKKGGE